MRLLPSHEGARPPPPPQKIPRPHIIQQNETLRALHNLLLPARISESLLLCARQKSAALFPLLLELSFQQKHFQLGFEALPFQRILRRLSKPLAPESLPPLLLRAALSDLFQRFFPEIFKDSGVTIRAMDFFAKPSPKTPLIETSLCLRPLSAKPAPPLRLTLFSPPAFPARDAARALLFHKKEHRFPPKLFATIFFHAGGLHITPHQFRSLAKGDILFSHAPQALTHHAPPPAPVPKAGA